MSELQKHSYNIRVHAFTYSSYREGSLSVSWQFIGGREGGEREKERERDIRGCNQKFPD
jgi:hypothetical protein